MEDITFELETRLNNNINRQFEIIKSLEFLPKGHINILYRNNRGYFYLTYREGKKVKNEYLGAEGKTDLTKVINKLHQRQITEAELKNLKNEEKMLKKLLKRAK